MGTDKRERKKANRNAKLEAERAAAARQRRIKMIRNAVILTVVIVVVLVLLNGCSSDDDSKAGSAGATTTEATEDSAPDTTDAGDVATETTTADSISAPAKGYGTTECPEVEEVIPEDASSSVKPTVDFDDAFQLCIDPERTYQATIETTEGTVVFDLDTERTPLTTNNFVSLARNGYYDGTELFRTDLKSGIIQGGSPHTQSNTDPGPGYTIPDEGLPFSKDDYGPGTLAMARTPDPDSASAQFFFLANEGGRFLGQPGAGTYQVFGKVAEGLDVLEAIAALDDGTGTETPSRSTSIVSVKITET